MKPYLIRTLKELALLGAIRDTIEISSLELSSVISSSQQTASRYLMQLDDEGMIVRDRGIKKQLIRITEKGSKYLNEEYLDYKKIFELSEKLSFVGEIVSGYGEGRYYTEQEGYLKQFRKKIGFTPHPGTLNIKIKNVEKNKLRLLKNYEGITIDSFKNDERTFGSVRCFKAEINGAKGAVVLPSRSHYSDILEFISSFCLRKTLDLKDGDRVQVIIYYRWG
ncbi:MAG: DUF120 domain-containing protein [Candidatus Thermoplasmatota archaeon]